jgi:hypothetical protein
MTAKTRTAKTALHACECSNWEFGSYGPSGSAESFQSTGTGCQAMTHRVFAQGHDAKLVGFMVRADTDGLEISKTTGGVKHTFPGAVDAAASISQALAMKAEVQLVAQNRRAAKKTVGKLAGKVAKDETKVTYLPTTRHATIKVGRWTYDATVEIATGEATYAKKLGGAVTAKLGEYTEV